jgi:hypothetical protein
MRKRHATAFNMKGTIMKHLSLGLPATVLGMAAALTVTPAYAKHLNIAVDGAKVMGDAIIFPSVLIDKDGYVVIHEVKDGTAVIPGSIGHVAVKAGTTENVSVPVVGAKSGTEYMAMIHYETNGNGTYDFGDGMTDVDTPGLKPDNTPYALQFKPGM